MCEIFLSSFIMCYFFCIRQSSIFCIVHKVVHVSKNIEIIESSKCGWKKPVHYQGGHLSWKSWMSWNCPALTACTPDPRSLSCIIASLTLFVMLQGHSGGSPKKLLAIGMTCFCYFCKKHFFILGVVHTDPFFGLV